MLICPKSHVTCLQNYLSGPCLQLCWELPCRDGGDLAGLLRLARQLHQRLLGGAHRPLLADGVILMGEDEDNVHQVIDKSSITLIMFYEGQSLGTLGKILEKYMGRGRPSLFQWCKRKKMHFPGKEYWPNFFEK